MFKTAYIGLFDRSLLHMSLIQVELALKKATSNAVFSRERFTTVTAYRGLVTKSQLLETLFTRN